MNGWEYSHRVWQAMTGVLFPVTAFASVGDHIPDTACLCGSVSPGLRVIFWIVVSMVACGVSWFLLRRMYLLLSRDSVRLRASEAKYRGLFEASADAIALFDMSKVQIIDCNDAMLRIFGCEQKGQLIGKPLKEFSPETQPCGTSSRVMAAERIAVALERGSNRFEWVFWRRDGSEFHAEVMLNVFTLNAEQVLQVSVRDVTARKRIEERYRLLAERANDVIWTADLALNWDYMSPAAERLCGFTIEECMKQTLDEILVPESQKVAEEARLSAIAAAYANPGIAPEPLVMELEFNCKDGSTVWVEVNATLILDRDGKPSQWVGISRNISARREAETQLARAKEIAEAADQSKSEFLANMSHEIRTPLTAILGFTDLLREECAAIGVSAAAADAVATITSNGKHLLTLINDILDLSKIEAGRVTVEHNDCRVDKIIGDVVSLMKLRAQGKGIRLVVDYEGAIPETIQTDMVRLRQVLVNLVGNAVKFTEQGTVRIVTRFLDNDRDGSKLEIEVSDTGCGLAEEDMPRIFHPFTQADSSTSRRFGGTGLGLAISRKLARLLGGNITVSSQLGEGSTFRVTIDPGPLVDASFREDLASTLMHEPLEGRTDTTGRVRLEGRVLLVEDGPDNQRLISRLIERAGAEVAIMDNGLNGCQAALGAYADGVPYDVILMDMQMPVMDGYQATRVLREAGYRGAIIALTANAMVGDEQKCLEAGCNAYLTKPINRDVFLPCVAGFLPLSEATAG